MKLIYCLLFAAMAAPAQGVNAYLSGTILDPADKVIADATVKVTSAQNNQTLVGRSTDAGLFRINGLASGTYSLTVEKDGFKPYRLESLDLIVGQEVSRTIRLEIGTIQEAIVVSEAIAEIERVASNGVRGSNYSPQEVANIPMIAGGQGRNYRALSFQTPGVGFTSAAHAPFTVSGNRPIGAVNTMVDSAEYNDPVSGNLLGRGLTEQPVSMETVEAFEMQTSNFKAEFGRATGAVVNLVTKQGTNEWHGSAYYFFQNEAMNARNPLLSSRNPIRTNMPGVTLSGPVQKNKLFFFGGYEVNSRNAYQASSTITTLTAEERARAVPTVRPLLVYYPLPNIAGTNLQSASVASPRTALTGILRGDYLVTDRHRLTGRVNWVNAIGPTRDRLGAGNADTINFSRSAVLNFDSTLGTHWYNQARFTYSTFYTRVDPSSPSLGDPAVNGQIGLMLVTGLPRLGPWIPPTETRFHNYTFAEDISRSAGRHILKAGVIGRKIQSASTSDRNFLGTMIFPSVPAFLAGQPLTYSRALGNSRIDQSNMELGWYLQDDWKFRPNLTINLGLRHEYYGVPSEKFGRLRQNYERDGNNFAPRVGFAWDLQGKSTMILRGGYGLFYSPLQMDFIAQSRYTPPQVTTFSRFQPRFPDLLAGALIGSDRYLVDRNLVNPYVQNWNLTVERQLFSKGSVLSVAYVGNRGLKLPRTALPNGGQNMPPALRPNPAQGVVTYLTGGVSADYHSFQTSLNLKVQRRLTLRSSYTFSKAMDNASDTALLPVDDRNLRLDRAVSDFNQPHLLSFFSVYDLPFFERNRWLGGWQLTGLVFDRSGAPFSLLANSNNAFGTLNNRINSVPGSINRTRSGSQWFSLTPGVNPAQIVPAAGQTGTLGRNTEQAPNFANLNLSLQKDIRLTEHFNAQFRAEAFNTLNRANYDAPINNLGNALFGRILTASEARQFQLMLKVVF
ncbi:MAG: TonB-dependent receptor [Acidobacteria bacterium]|nr:TonB-dependent receptor [Acidobacteriota bacterium]